MREDNKSKTKGLDLMNNTEIANVGLKLATGKVKIWYLAGGSLLMNKAQKPALGTKE